MYNVTRAPVAPIDQAPGVPVKGRTGSSALAAALQAHQTAISDDTSLPECRVWKMAREVARDIDVPLRHAAIHMDCGWAVVARAALAQTSWECWQRTHGE